MSEILAFLTQAFQFFLEVFLHLDVYLDKWILLLGPYIYVLLFVIVFCETGLVVTPFLPGDSLLFALGTFSATGTGELHFWRVAIVLLGAAILGDAVNYTLGRYVGPKIFRSKTSRWFNQEHLISAKHFYDRHGGKAIILARFLPIFRTFAPFVAGIGRMGYPRFSFFNITGALAWVFLLLTAGLV